MSRTRAPAPPRVRDRTHRQLDHATPPDNTHRQLYYHATLPDNTHRQLDHATPSVAIGRMWCMKGKCVDPRAGTTGKLAAAAAAAAVTDPVDIRLTLILGIFLEDPEGVLYCTVKTFVTKLKNLMS